MKLFINKFVIKNESYLFLMHLFAAAVYIDIGTKIKEYFVFFIISSIVYLFTILYRKNSLLLYYFVFYAFFIGILKFPENTNHGNIEFFLSAFFMLIFALNCFFSTNYYQNTFDLNFLFRVILFLMLFFAGFHKLNTAFINPISSCVESVNTLFLLRFFNYDYKLPNILIYFSVYATYFIELIVPFGIFFNKTRKFAFTLIVSFLLLISLNFVRHFAGLALFLLAGSCLDLSKLNFNSIKNFQTLQILIFFSSVFYFSSQFFQNFRTISVLIYLLFLILITYLILKNWNYVASRDNYFSWNFKLIFITIFMIFWSLQCYLGLGNTSNLTMFSNLVTEKSRSNHLLIDTKITKIFSFEEDLILINTASSELINEIKRRNYSFKLGKFLLPKIELQKAIHRISKSNKNIYIDYQYNKKHYVIKDVGNSSLNQIKWWYKLIYLRPVQIEGENKCQW